MSFIYKLKYTDRATAITDLIAKGVIDINENNTETTQAVVEIGLIVDTPAVIVDNEIVTPATYIDGYHFDIMVNEKIDLGRAEIKIKNPKHTFYGI